ncbi:MAG: rod-binding protein [Gemmobacter sp.]|nr:rod-binding protein [Gemmobacter sp.]
MTLPPVTFAQTYPNLAPDAVLRAKAVELESAFIAEMLGHVGLGQMSESFGGGAGEDQFSSFLRRAQADAIAKRGGIGLAEHLFNAMKGLPDGN